MASPGQVTDADGTVTLGPWPVGVNNRAYEFELPDGALRDAVNVDITNGGRTLRRRGATALRKLAQIHSVFGGSEHLLFMQAGALRRGIPPADVSLRTGLSAADMDYVEVNKDVYYSNGEVTGKVIAAGTDAPWGLKLPISQPVLTPGVVGGLPAGRYQIAVTFVCSDGEESGALSPQPVDVVEGGGIQLTAIPQPVEAGVNRVRIYRTSTNGDKLYVHQTLLIGVVSLLVGVSVLGRELETLLGTPFPPCTLLDYYNGRIYGAQGNILWYSLPFRYGFLDSYIQFSEEVSVLEATQDGCYVCADQTYFYPGATPSKQEQRTLLPFGGVYGSGTKVRNSRDVAWFSKNGWVVGKPGGSIEQITDKHVAVPGYAAGAALFREDRGIRQLVGAFQGGVDSSFVAGDSVDAEIIRSET